jgi:NAD(P)-dependent dehydrogenase (short-subunit alcohol dehydrogenase family)
VSRNGQRSPFASPPEPGAWSGEIGTRRPNAASNLRPGGLYSSRVLATTAGSPHATENALSIALVTGANRGLGYATARALAKSGSRVILSGREPAKVEDAAHALRAEGLDVQGLVMDVTSPDSVAGAAEQVERKHARLDVLVNNAGILPEATQVDTPDFADVNIFETTFRTNVFGVIAVTQAFLPLLRRSAMGRVVNVSTTMGSLNDQSNPDSPWYQLGVPAYRSAKAALNSVTISLAKALADTDIKVTSICPGWVQTDLAPGNREHAPVTADQAAQVVLTAATLPASAASGTFIDQFGAVPW